MGEVIGYARVSSQGQSLQIQIDKLTAYGCDKIYQEKTSGVNQNRPELISCLDGLCFLSQKVINLLFGSIAHKIAQFNHSSFNLCHINIQKIKVGKFPSKI